jgi:hypothetical protein
MPDHYGATIRIWPWRDDDTRTHEVSVWLTDEYGAIQPEDGNEMLGAPIVSHRGVLSVEVEEAQEGIDEFTEAGHDPLEEPSLVGLLKQAGLSFQIRDARGGGGCEISWRPGLEKVRERPLVAHGTPALSQELAEVFLQIPSDGRLRGTLRNYFAPIAGHVNEADEHDWLTTEAVVCESDSGSPTVLYASPGAEVLVIPAFQEDEHDVYSPQDVLNVVAEIEDLRGFAWSKELKVLAEELRTTARRYAGEA